MLQNLFLLIYLGTLSQELTLNQVMEDPVWLGEIPSQVRVSTDGSAAYFQIDQPIPQMPAYRKVDLKSGKVEACSGEGLAQALRSQIFTNGELSLVEVEGDIWRLGKNGSLSPLISRKGNLSFVRFIGKTTFVFRDGIDLHLFDSETGASRQISDFALKDEDDEKDTWYSAEEKTMLKFVENLHKREEYSKEFRDMKRDLGVLSVPKTVHLGSGRSLGYAGVPGSDRFLVDVSPDMKYLSFVSNLSDTGPNTEFADFINKEVAVRAKPARSKVGKEKADYQLHLYDREADELVKVDLSKLPEIATDRLEKIRAEQEERDKDFLEKAPEGPRMVTILPGGFSADGSKFLATAISTDWKDKWIFLVDVKTGEPSLVHHHYDEAWVQIYARDLGTGRGDYHDYVSTNGWWRADGKKIVFLSDESGYQHLYQYDLSSGKTEALTSGDWEVNNPMESHDGKDWFFHATKEHPGEVHFYRMPIDGGTPTRLTEGEGMHYVRMSHDNKVMVDYFSETNYPPVLRVKLGRGTWKPLFDGVSDAFKSYNFVKPEHVTYKNRDGKMVHARLYRPENPNGAGVVFVHGAGYLQNAHKGWSGYYREYMFHNLLLREGYTVLDPDYQASAGYGRDWRTAIYRYMGDKDLTDVLDGASYLKDEVGVDGERVGVYGGSYGGFITLMALFTSPGTFKAGAALRPVTDWSYYNHWYSSRILNTPFNDPLAYRRSSPIYFAENLQDHLLICHGMVDDNVQFQDSVRLAQKLIELRKKNWELAAYPVEPHGFKTPSSWYDEYRRIHELFNRVLLP